MQDRRRLWLAVFLAAFLLCGCQETPEKVRKNMEDYGANPQVGEAQVSYCGIEGLRASKRPGIEAENLILPEHIDFSGVEEVGLLRLSYEKGFLEQEGTAEKYSALFGVEAGKLQEGESSFGDKVLRYDDEKEAEYLSLAENGGVVYMGGQNYGEAPNTVEGTYSVDQEGLEGVTVQLGDGSVGLSEFCHSAEGWLEENFPVEGLRYRISDVLVRSLEGAGDAKRISACAEYDYKGMRLNNHAMPLVVMDEELNSRNLTTFLSVQLEYDSLSGPSFFFKE